MISTRPTNHRRAHRLSAVVGLLALFSGMAAQTAQAELPGSAVRAALPMEEIIVTAPRPSRAAMLESDAEHARELLAEMISESRRRLDAECDEAQPNACAASTTGSENLKESRVVEISNLHDDLHDALAVSLRETGRVPTLSFVSDSATD